MSARGGVALTADTAATLPPQQKISSDVAPGAAVSSFAGKPATPSASASPALAPAPGAGPSLRTPMPALNAPAKAHNTRSPSRGFAD